LINSATRGAAAFAAALLIMTALPPAAEAGTLTVKDKLGRTVSVNLPVRRVVLFETYELIAALGVWDKVAGISRYAYENDLILALRPGIAKTIPSAGSGADINIESLLRLRPDLVITWTFKPESIRFMEERGLKVIALYPESIPELFETMRLEGRIFGKQARVEACIGRMKKMFAFISERCRAVPDGNRKRVVWLGGKPTTVAGGTGINNDLIGLMNAVNPAASQQERSADVSMERIVAWNPEVVFIWGGARFVPGDLLGSPQWRHVDAVRKGRVHKAPKWGTWSPRLAVIALWMAMKTYPDQFRDVDFDKAADNFYRSVYGIPYGKASRIDG
jgi:iron complex transport system substrate-binding protein